MVFFIWLFYGTITFAFGILWAESQKTHGVLQCVQWLQEMLFQHVVLFSNIVTSCNYQSHCHCPDKWSNSLKFRLKERKVSSFVKISCMGEMENVFTTSCCYCNGLTNRTNEMQEKGSWTLFFQISLTPVGVLVASLHNFSPVLVVLTLSLVLCAILGFILEEMMKQKMERTHQCIISLFGAVNSQFDCSQCFHTQFYSCVTITCNG